jgi:YidC/Oxa1 family membrane protein insertase
MDKNLLLAVTLSLGVYALWFGVIEKRIAPPPPHMAYSPNAPTPGQPASASQPSMSGQPSRPGQPYEPAVDKETVLKDAESVTFGKSSALVSPHGAAIVSWRDPEPLGVVELVEDPRPGFFSTFPDLTFKRDEKALGVVYKAKRKDGAIITKEFLPEGPASLPRLRVTITNPSSKEIVSGPWTLSMGPGLGTIETEQKENVKVWRAIGLTAPEGGLEGKVDAFKPGDHVGNYRWLGVDNRYFLAAVLPASGDFDRVESALPPLVTLTAKSSAIPAQGSRSWEIPYYIGAKGHNWLSHYNVGLERAINFGFFAWLGRHVLQVLNRLHTVTGNWGWSIIILTVLIQIALFPFTFQSLKSMAKMRRLQPEIARLQQRYAKDQAKLSAETMELYKKNGANPLGGCLPMVVQMPVFYALYNALRSAWELHGAVWIFWIKDLSAKDPYYVLPLVMGGIMFVQNKLNAQQTADPAQAQMMTFMPVIFTFMFLKFPAGLVLYWLTNSLASTTQQLVLRKYLDQGAAESAGPARR